MLGRIIDVAVDVFLPEVRILEIVNNDKLSTEQKIKKLGMAINAGDSDEILLGEFYHLRTYRNLARAVRNKVYEIGHRIKTERPDELVISIPEGDME